MGLVFFIIPSYRMACIMACRPYSAANKIIITGFRQISQSFYLFCFVTYATYNIYQHSLYQVNCIFNYHIIHYILFLNPTYSHSFIIDYLANVLKNHLNWLFLFFIVLKHGIRWLYTPQN